MKRGQNTYKDIAGQRFGKLRVLDRAGSRDWKSLWLVRCDCGVTKVILGESLQSGNTKSCGCAKGWPRSQRGASRTGAYKSWKAMMERCYSQRSASYPRYGSLGVTVCDRWHSFAGFHQDMGERPIGKTLDRIDNSKGYEPTNCRWATPREQRANQNRFNPLLSIRGGSYEWTFIA